MAPYRLDVVSLAPQAFAPLLELGVIGRAFNAGTAPVGLVVHLAMAIRGEVPGVMQMQLGDARVEGTTDHPQLQQRSKRLRRQAHHIKAIGRHAASGHGFGHPADVRAETALHRCSLGIYRRGAAQAQVGPREPDPLLNLHAVSPADCLLYTSPSPRDVEESRMPSSA